MPANLVETIEIDAPPARVWQVVSDLSRMSEWSPTTAKVIVVGGVREGARTINVNRDGFKVWPTTSTVTSVQPDRRIAFRINENRTEWSFDLEPLDDGTRTRVTQMRDASNGTTAISRTLVDRVFGGEQTFETALVRGMQQTLQRIKTEAESAPADR